MTEPDHDMELVERLARIHANTNPHGTSWATMSNLEREGSEQAMRAVLAELHPHHSPYAGPHTLTEVFDRTATFRRIVRLDDGYRGPVDLTVDRSIWFEWGRPLDVFVTALVIGPR